MTRAATLVAVIGFAWTAGVRPAIAGAQDHAHPTGQTDKLGTVHFATSCAPQVQPQFDRAVALLHSFEFGASIRAFNGVLSADSTCAMAHWGIALSRWSNPMAAVNRTPAQLRDGRNAVANAEGLSARTTDREHGYIRAIATLFDSTHANQRARLVAYERAMDAHRSAFPADTEATIFYALALAAAAPPTDKTYANQLKAGELLEPLWAKQPDHPGLAHYIIHSYDYPPLADKARAAARRYAGIAPTAAHALHMPSHTFTRVGMWQESINTNTRSMQVALANGSIAEALHAADYAVYANLQLGRTAAAKAILDSLPSLRSRFNPDAVTGAAPGSAGLFALATIPARYALERGAWGEAAALEPRTTSYPFTEAMTYFARALGAARSGKVARAKVDVDSLAAVGKRLSAQGEPYWVEQVVIQQLAAQAWIDFAEGRREAALAGMREAVTREDATEKNAVTPGPLAPARELLGDMLQQLGRSADARAAYKMTLQKEPNRRRSLRGVSGRVSP